MVAKSIFPLSSRTKWILFLTALFIAHVAALVGIIKSGADLRQMSAESFFFFIMSLIAFFITILSSATGGGFCMFLGVASFIDGIILAIIASALSPIFVFFYLLAVDLALVFKLMD
jgi:type III secretory pathway component EscS